MSDPTTSWLTRLRLSPPALAAIGFFAGMADGLIFRVIGVEIRFGRDRCDVVGRPAGLR